MVLHRRLRQSGRASLSLCPLATRHFTAPSRPVALPGTPTTQAPAWYHALPLAHQSPTNTRSAPPFPPAAHSGLGTIG
ncbi:hypothetical protein GQ53DRAFT_746854 [Thozetella sp. PMI_491]|nr:hypothetical protein GQ53DRAFT_746854 [Thozetella sp. PMI_491]